MQLETTNPWKSKTHSTVPPGLMLAIGLATLAVLDAGCSSSAQPKAPAPAEVSVAEVICKQIGDSDEFTSYDFQIEMATHYGRMVADDETVTLFANPEDAAEELGFDLLEEEE